MRFHGTFGVVAAGAMSLGVISPLGCSISRSVFWQMSALSLAHMSEGGEAVEHGPPEGDPCWVWEGLPGGHSSAQALHTALFQNQQFYSAFK